LTEEIISLAAPPEEGTQRQPSALKSELRKNITAKTIN
jgi:hypothetical protein